MRIGIGLPNSVPGTTGRTMLEWARRAEGRGFSGLATIGRVVYPTFEELIALSAAAAVTERIGLLTNILLAPTRNPVQLAKEAASLDQLSGGRFTLGIAVGSRPDDYEASGLGFRDRGRRLDAAIELMRRAWSGEHVAGSAKPVTPRPIEGMVPILFGGTSDRAIERTVRWGSGWTAGGSAAEVVGPFAERVRAAWADAGREGRPRIVALSYFALGDEARDRAAGYLEDYYGGFGARIAANVPTSGEALQETVGRFRDAGVDELFLDPTIAELDQVDMLADAVLERGPARAG